MGKDGLPAHSPEEAVAAVRRALDDGAPDSGAVRALVDRLTPVVQARVTRALLRRRGESGRRDVRQEVEDLTQEVFVALFRNRGQALRSWDPARGLSLENFVGLLAQHQVASILRSGRACPWTDVPTEATILDGQLQAEPSAAPDRVAASREELESLLAQVRAKLSPRGLVLFWRLLVREEPIEAVAAQTGMTAEAIYAWRSRLGRLARSMAGGAPASGRDTRAGQPGTAAQGRSSR
jgi:DNA-directed RNA polymerase specialized sigma24 family protein